MATEKHENIIRQAQPHQPKNQQVSFDSASGHESGLQTQSPVAACNLKSIKCILEKERKH